MMVVCWLFFFLGGAGHKMGGSCFCLFFVGVRLEWSIYFLGGHLF